MKINTALVGALVSIASAHSDPRDVHAGIPKLVGGRVFLSELKARNALPSPLEIPPTLVEERHEPVKELVERQNVDGRCGPGFGKCTSNCCSAAGYCGTGSEYCAAPDCQFLFGPGCDANKIPAGDSTANIARPQLGDVAYGGVGIYDCEVAGDVAFTFDDGPYNYTSDLLDKLKVYNAKATFMITGNNLGKGPIDSTPQWSNLIKRMVAEGHQIASHTWSHQNLTDLDTTHFKNQMYYNEMAFRNILGYFPTYMRPPFSECNNTCSALLADLGYHVTYFDLDTAGYLNDSPTLIQNSKNIWDAAINNSNNKTDNFLEIEHDIHYQTVYNLTDYILASMYKHGYKSVTVGQCLGDPAANWYRSGNASATIPQSVSEDGSCSATVTCQGSIFGNCCSQNGFCGSTSDYCGTGCQPASGTCGVASSSSSIRTSTSSTRTSSAPTSSTSPGKIVSTDGSCSSSVTCLGSTFGNCCSQYGYCGSTDLFCGAGCQSAFGTCSGGSSVSSTKLPATTSPPTTSPTKPPTTTSKPTSTSTTAIVSPTPTALKVSPDGTCGGVNKYTCKGSRFGACCSKGGRCGNRAWFFIQPYCGLGCQKAYGSCS